MPIYNLACVSGVQANYDLYYALFPHILLKVPDVISNTNLGGCCHTVPWFAGTLDTDTERKAKSQTKKLKAEK